MGAQKKEVGPMIIVFKLRIMMTMKVITDNTVDPRLGWTSKKQR